jgi:hypothetical protein
MMPPGVSPFIRQAVPKRSGVARAHSEWSTPMSFLFIQQAEKEVIAKNEVTPPRKPRIDFPTFVLHWVLVLAVAVNFATGMRVAADSDKPIGASLSTILPQGNVLAIHAGSALVLIAVAVTYVVFLAQTKLLRRHALRGLVYELCHRKTRCCGVNRLLYWVSFTLLVGAFLTQCNVFGRACQW